MCEGQSIYLFEGYLLVILDKTKRTIRLGNYQLLNCILRTLFVFERHPTPLFVWHRNNHRFVLPTTNPCFYNILMTLFIMTTNAFVCLEENESSCSSLRQLNIVFLWDNWTPCLLYRQLTPLFVLVADNHLFPYETIRSPCYHRGYYALNYWKFLSIPYSFLVTTIIE